MGLLRLPCDAAAPEDDAEEPESEPEAAAPALMQFPSSALPSSAPYTPVGKAPGGSANVGVKGRYETIMLAKPCAA